MLDAVTVTLNPAIDRTLVIPRFAAGAVNRVESERSNAGGKGVNVASSLADAGLRIAATGFLGRENTAPFERLFAGKSIEDRFVRIEGATRVGIKITDPALRQTTDINFPGAPARTADLAALFGQIDRLAAEAPWFVLSGSLPPGVPSSVYADLVTRLRSRGGRTVIDTSGDALVQAAGAGPDVMKPNIHEFESLLGAPLETEAAVVAGARHSLAGGTELVVVSMGSAGACFVDAGDAVVARPPAVTVHSTVGAGDAMVAGIVAARLRGLGLRDTARVATAFAVDALTRSGDRGTSAMTIESLAGQVTLAEPDDSARPGRE